MLPVQKRKKKSLPRWFRILFFPLIAAFCAGLYLLFSAELPDRENQTVPSSLAQQESDRSDPLLLLERPETELFSVSFFPADDESYVLAYSNGALYPEGDPDFPVRSIITDPILFYATNIRAMDIVYDEDNVSAAPDAADFGLSPAAYTVIIRYTDDSQITVSLGDPVVSDGFVRYYMTTSIREGIYLVSEDLYNAFSSEKIMLHPVEKPALHRDRITSLRFGGQTEFTISVENGIWSSDEPVVYPLWEDKVSSLLSKVADIRFSSWVGTADGVDCTALGLDEPRVSLEIVLKDPDTFEETIHTLLIGNDYNTVSFYCRWDDTVYIGTNFTLGFLLGIDPSAYYVPNPVDLPVGALLSVSVITDPETDHAKARIYLMEYDQHVLPNGELETDADTGEAIYDVTVRRGSNNDIPEVTLPFSVPPVNDPAEPVSSDGFMIWYRRLTEVAASGYFTPQKTAASSPAYTVILQTPAFIRTVSFINKDPVNYDIAIDGISLSYTEAGRISLLDELP